MKRGSKSNAQVSTPFVQNRGKTNMDAKDKSAVWNFFDKVDKTTTKCNLCAVLLSYKDGSTSSMKKHLSGRHKKTNLTEKKKL